MGIEYEIKEFLSLFQQGKDLKLLKHNNIGEKL